MTSLSTSFTTTSSSLSSVNSEQWFVLALPNRGGGNASFVIGPSGAAAVTTVNVAVGTTAPTCRACTFNADINTVVTLSAVQSARTVTLPIAAGYAGGVYVRITNSAITSQSVTITSSFTLAPFPSFSPIPIPATAIGAGSSYNGWTSSSNSRVFYRFRPSTYGVYRFEVRGVTVGRGVGLGEGGRVTNARFLDGCAQLTSVSGDVDLYLYNNMPVCSTCSASIVARSAAFGTFDATDYDVHRDNIATPVFVEVRYWSTTSLLTTYSLRISLVRTTDGTPPSSTSSTNVGAVAGGIVGSLGGLFLIAIIVVSVFGCAAASRRAAQAARQANGHPPPATVVSATGGTQVALGNGATLILPSSAPAPAPYPQPSAGMDPQPPLSPSDMHSNAIYAHGPTPSGGGGTAGHVKNNPDGPTPYPGPSGGPGMGYGGGPAAPYPSGPGMAPYPGAGGPAPYGPGGPAPYGYPMAGGGPGMGGPMPYGPGMGGPAPYPRPYGMGLPMGGAGPAPYPMPMGGGMPGGYGMAPRPYPMPMGGGPTYATGNVPSGAGYVSTSPAPSTAAPSNNNNNPGPGPGSAPVSL